MQDQRQDAERLLADKIDDLSHEGEVVLRLNEEIKGFKELLGVMAESKVYIYLYLYIYIYVYIYV
jgi:hypothetical protein